MFWAGTCRSAIVCQNRELLQPPVVDVRTTLVNMSANRAKKPPAKRASSPGGGSVNNKKKRPITVGCEYV